MADNNLTIERLTQHNLELVDRVAFLKEELKITRDLFTRYRRECGGPTGTGGDQAESYDNSVDWRSTSQIEDDEKKPGDLNRCPSTTIGVVRRCRLKSYYQNGNGKQHSMRR
jgi:hypothetical protein